MPRGLLALAAVAALAGGKPTFAQQVGDLAAGRRLAETWCSNCHVIGPNVTGPGSDAVPTFPNIARMPSTTAMSLRVFLQTPHARMPDIQMSREQVDDVIAYILSLRDQGAKR
ncbi:MAG: cytochrome c [Acetobacteraceae bacterium]|nr:cytochrome c [Acetobacteraceae bacterium]